MLGELPAWGFYVRHVDGLVMQNIKLRLMEKDYRTAYIFDDTRNVNLEEISLEGDEKEYHMIMHHSEQIQTDSTYRIKKI